MEKTEKSQVETVDASKMSVEQLRDHINAQVAVEEAKAENPDEKSEKSEAASKKEETPAAKETPKKEQTAEEKEKAEKAASETETPSDKQKKEEKPLDYEKSYKELQRKFTENNNKYKGEISSLSEKLEALTALVKGKTSSTTEEKSIIEEIRAKSPETAQLFERFRDELEAKYDKKFDEKLKTEIDPLKSSISNSKEIENASKFAQGLDGFINSDLKVYEADLIGILNERYDSQDALEAAVRKDPNIFAEVKKELASRIMDGTVETKSSKAKSKTSKEEKIEKKKEEIEKQPARSSKESAPVETELTVADAKKLSAAELRKKLPVKED